MQYIYFGTVFAAMIVFLLSSLLLFSQRKRGERSRTFFACINLLSVFNYIHQIINFEKNSTHFEVMPVSLLLIGIFVITTYILYPIEVIAPGWLNPKRVLKLYLPVTCLILFYIVTQKLGVVYTPFESISDLLDHVASFQVLFRIVLALLLFLPAVLLYFVPYTHKYNNTDNKWMRGYVAAVIINDAAFLVVINSSAVVVRTLYYFVSVSCSLYIVYQELFVRLIRQPKVELEMEFDNAPNIDSEMKTETKGTDNDLQISPIFARLEQYVNRTQAWRNPDLSVRELTNALCTNRTYLRDAIQQQGYESYSSYINGKRIAEFIQIIEQQGGGNYSQTFFDVGFRSKTTALRNFREFIGATPSEYFQNSQNRISDNETSRKDTD